MGTRYRNIVVGKTQNSVQDRPKVVDSCGEVVKPRIEISTLAIPGYAMKGLQIVGAMGAVGLTMLGFAIADGL